MAIRTFGSITYRQREKYNWEHKDIRPEGDKMLVIERAEPHVVIKLKQLFAIIGKTEIAPIFIPVTDGICEDLRWFLTRYPFEVSKEASKIIKTGSRNYTQHQRDMEQLYMPGYTPPFVQLKDGEQARPYQLEVPPFHRLQKRFLLGDDIGLGKTLSSILTLFNPGTLPCAVVLQTHLPKQWKEKGIERFTNLNVHIIKNGGIYDLPKADVYIFKYGSLAKWVSHFTTGFFKSVILDEVQEVRRPEAEKSKAAKILSANAEYCIGLSATPIYNYGDEIYNIMDVIKPGCMGMRDDFLREWCRSIGSGKYAVNDTQAMRSYLLEQYLMLRRTREDVKMQLPPINKIIHYVDYDDDEVESSEQLMRKLAIKVTTGTFVERGQAARELDAYVRMITGVSKAKYVAAYCKILLRNDIPIVLAGWHRDVYDIWLNELGEFNPVMYTGTESPKQKDEAVRKFTAGESKCFIISNRSGIGLDGLQYCCKDLVQGELDWSPKVHEQLAGRVDRDGQTEQVTVHYMVSDFGSDPVMVEILGLKNAQSSGILDPLSATDEQFSDDSRIMQLAKNILVK